MKSSINVRCESGICLVEVGDRLDGDSSDLVAKAVELSAVGCSSVLFDLTRIAFVDEEGLRGLLLAMLKAHDRNIPSCFQIQQPLRDALDAAGLWWIGVVDDGLSAEIQMGEAFEVYVKDNYRFGTS